MARVADRGEELDAAAQVAWSQIGRSDEVARIAAVGEAIDARVLEETADDRHDANAVAEVGHAGPQRTDAAYDEVDVDAIARRAIQRSHDVRIGKPVELRGDPCGPAG